MALIPQNFIDDLLNRTDIVDTISHYVPLKKAGKNFVACCPFHNEKTPSFHVTASKQMYKCFGCGASGNLISFIMEYEHLTFPETIEHLATQQGLTLPSTGTNTSAQPSTAPLNELLEQSNHFYQRQLRQHPKAEQAINYLKNRGITGKTAQHYQVGFAPPGWNNLIQHFQADPKKTEQLLTAGMCIKNEKQRSYDRFRNRIMFPIRNRSGKMVGFGARVIGEDQPKYLNSPETPVFHKARELYGLYEARKASALTEVLIVEGYMDVLSLAQHGLTQTVATLGTAVTQEHIQLLFRYTSKLVFCFDGDQAGYKAAWRALEQSLAELYEGRSIRFMFLAAGEDPDSYIQKKGVENFVAAQQKADDLATFLLQHLHQHINSYGVDQQAELIQVASPLINKIPNPILQQLLLEQLAQHVKLPATQLQRWFVLNQANQITHTKTSSLALSPLRTALAILLQNPQWATHLTEHSDLNKWLQQPNLKGEEKLFAQIYQRSLAHASLTTSQLVERWRGHPAYQLVNHLAEHNFPIAEHLEQVLLEALRHHLQHNQVSLIDLFLAKARKEKLSDTEKQELKELIQAQKQPKKLLSAVD